MKVVLVDGPGRGRVFESYSPTAVSLQFPSILEPMISDLLSDTGIMPSFDSVTYYIVKVKMFGVCVAIGSTSYSPRNIDLFESLASDLVKSIA